MCRRFNRTQTLALAVVIAWCGSAQAADITAHVPDNALGFAVVRNLAGTNARLQNLIRMFQAPLPAPLDLFKLQTGFGEGFNDEGDLLVALLPTRDEFGTPGPLALVPVTDYAAFVKTFNGDPSGEICPVTVSGEDVLVAKKDAFALFMNPEYRADMQRIVTAEPAVPESVAVIEEWMGGNNGTLVLLPAGAELLVSMASEGLATARQQMEQGFEDVQLQEELATLRAGLDFYSKLLSYVGDEVKSAAFGVKLDDAGNVMLGLRAVAKEDGTVAGVGEIAASQEPLAGVPAGPFVIAGGGPWPQEFSEAMLGLSLEVMQSMPQIYGLGNATEEDMQKLEETFRKATEGLKHMVFLMRPGEEAEPVVSNIYTLFHVESAEQYFENYRESMRVWNELISKAEGEKKFEYEISDEQIAGKPGVKITMDLTAAMGMPNVPQTQQMLRAMFGEDGKMIAYLAQVDESRVLIGYSGKPDVEEMIEMLQQQDEAGLAGEDGISTTAALLPSDAPFVTYVSPQGCVQWFSRLLKVMMGAFGGGVPPIPEYPATPPVGIAVGLEGRVIETDVAFPAEMLQGLSEFIQQNR